MQSHPKRYDQHGDCRFSRIKFALVMSDLRGDIKAHNFPHAEELHKKERPIVATLCDPCFYAYNSMWITWYTFAQC